MDIQNKNKPEFRGRTWEAWFTNQIPVSNGPWKFHGLPGIIMQVSNDQNHFSFTCIGISREKVPIKNGNGDMKELPEKMPMHI